MGKPDQHGSRASLEGRPPRDGEVERGMIHGTIIQEHRDIPVLRHTSVAVEGVETTLHEGNGLCANYALIEDMYRSTSLDAWSLLNVKKFKKSILARCLGWVTQERASKPLIMEMASFSVDPF